MVDVGRETTSTSSFSLDHQHPPFSSTTPTATAGQMTGSTSSSSATALVAALSEPNPSLPERAIRSTRFPTATGQVVSSWKVAEHLYRSHAALLPTLARGLFTIEDKEGEHRVVGRGYDKFFNVDEVAYTSVSPDLRDARAIRRPELLTSSLHPFLQWSAIESSTSGPYSLTLKSNGCLILISALDSQTLLVTSKHALDVASERDDEAGYRGGHARVGREWVKKHLDRVGWTEEELAAELWKRQVSAVAEVRPHSHPPHFPSPNPLFLPLAAAQPAK